MRLSPRPPHEIGSGARSVATGCAAWGLAAAGAAYRAPQARQKFAFGARASPQLGQRRFIDRTVSGPPARREARP
jgi:hypothetical protein